MQGDEHKGRSQLVLNIEDKFLKCVEVLFESDSSEDGAKSLYKFVYIDVSDQSEEWLYYKRFHSQDSWSELGDS